MRIETLAGARQLILDTRYLCGEAKALSEGRFGELLSQLDDSRAGARIRYWFENMRALVKTDPHTA